MDNFEQKRKEVIENLEALGRLKSPEIKKAMMKIRRELFVTPEYKNLAYADTPLPIVGGATISAPHMYAITFEAVKLKKGEKVLEIGAGSGYGAAIAQELIGDKGLVVTIEIIKEVYEFAKKNLKIAGYDDVKIIYGDGSLGCKEYAPYDCIISTAACPEIPKPWVEQLKPNGRLVSPVGSLAYGQDFIYLKKLADGKIEKKNLGGVVFLPLTGKYGYKT